MNYGEKISKDEYNLALNELYSDTTISAAYKDRAEFDKAIQLKFGKDFPEDKADEVYDIVTNFRNSWGWWTPYVYSFIGTYFPKYIERKIDLRVKKLMGELSSVLTEQEIKEYLDEQ